jgi:hypothetical protein
MIFVLTFTRGVWSRVSWVNVWCKDVDSRSIKLIELLHSLSKTTDLEALIDIILPYDRLEIFPSLIERDVQKTLRWIRSVAICCIHYARKIRWVVSNDKLMG